MRLNNDWQLEKANILLVDDRAENLVALEAVLMSEQYHLMAASSGEEALKLILKHDFAVILMDVQMPGMNGFETAELIKTRESSMHIPIIFITAISKAQEHIIRGYSAGAVDYIVKPFHPETLKLKIEGFVKLHRNRHLLQQQSELLWRGSKQVATAGSPSLDVNTQTEWLSPNGQTIMILESIADAFFAVDSDWRFTYINQEAERQFGVSRIEMIGRSIWSVPTVMGGPLDEYRQAFELALTTQNPVHFEAHFEAGDRWFEIRIYPSTDGLSVYFKEVTERKRMEQELQRSRQYFRQIFNSSPSMMALFEPAGGCIDVNDSWTRTTGYSLAEMRGRTADVLAISAVEEENGQTRGADYFENPVHNLRVGYMTKHGEKREGLLSTERLDVYGELRTLCVITDITDRSQMDKQIARLGRLNLIGEMAAGIAHEIRNPMTAVRGFLQLSKHSLNSDYVDIMIGELDRANGIITDFLTLAKNAISNRTLQPLNDIIETIYPLVEAEALRVGKHVETELADCPPLLLDEKEIRQLILNMVKNALDAMKEGGTVTLRTYSSEHEIVLEIADSGGGIPDDIMDKIGTPFFTTKEHGTGLGLAVCYSIASRHHACIEFRSDAGGTTFYVRFQRPE